MAEFRPPQLKQARIWPRSSLFATKSSCPLASSVVSDCTCRISSSHGAVWKHQSSDDWKKNNPFLIIGKKAEPKVPPARDWE